MLAHRRLPFGSAGVSRHRPLTSNSQPWKAQLVIPMHYFSSFTLHRFLDVAKNRKWDVEFAPVPTTTVSKTTLPANPKVLVLPGR